MCIVLLFSCAHLFHEVNYPCISLQALGRKKCEISNNRDTYNNRVNLAFGDLDNDAGMSALNEFMSDKSYVGGFLPSQADTILFEAFRAPPLPSHPHALRWFLHIQSFGGDRKYFPISVQVRWLFCFRSLWYFCHPAVLFLFSVPFFLLLVNVIAETLGLMYLPVKTLICLFTRHVHCT
jgi:hypothetical protein